MKLFSYTAPVDSIQTDGDTEVLGMISEGTMFRIYKARKGSRYVILKAPVTADAMSIEILRREYGISSSLSHPCIVATSGFETDTPVGPAIVMEYIEGLSLDEFVATGPTLFQRKAVLNDILDGISYLHHRGIIHNDLKPDNIIITCNGAARIIDFGLSASDDSVYRGCLGGTRGYTAPEILNGDGSAGMASDIYSIGMLINLLFGGRRYRRIAQKCIRTAPSERPQDIRVLQLLISRRDRMPALLSSIAVLLATVCILTIIVIRQESGIERQIRENVMNYSEEAADSLRKNKIDNIKALEDIYAAQLEPSFRKAIRMLHTQEYREAAQEILTPYTRHAANMIDSILKAYPISTDGIASDESWAICNVYKRNYQEIDSLLQRLPSIYDLPIGRQRDSLSDHVLKLRKEYLGY